MAGRTAPRVQDWREGRRLRALELKAQGWAQRRIAEALGVTEGAVSQWVKRAREGGGVEALRHRRPPGRPAKLTAAQRVEVPALLAKGAEAYGFVGAVWTTARVAVVLERTFGVRYDPSHVGRLLKRLNWSVQQPERRATQRDEAAIQRWRDETWPAFKQRLKQTL